MSLLQLHQKLVLRLRDGPTQLLRYHQQGLSQQIVKNEAGFVTGIRSEDTVKGAERDAEQTVGQHLGTEIGQIIVIYSILNDTVPYHHSVIGILFVSYVRRIAGVILSDLLTLPPLLLHVVFKSEHVWLLKLYVFLLDLLIAVHQGRILDGPVRLQPEEDLGGPIL